MPRLDEVLAHRGRAAFAERQVVFGRADVAGVAFDLDLQVRVLLQRAHRFVERAHRFRPQAVAVEVEVHVLEDDLLHRRLDHLDGDRVDAVPPLPSSTVTVTGTGPSTIGAVHGVSGARARS